MRLAGAQGVAVWLDHLSRELLTTSRHVVGVTTNPTIFASALAKGDRHDARLSDLAELGASTEAAVFTVTTDDARAACDVLSPVCRRQRKDGRVSIEVDPRLARDAAATADMARALRSAVDRDNMFVKIPAAARPGPARPARTRSGPFPARLASPGRPRPTVNRWLPGPAWAACGRRPMPVMPGVC
jgi:transaldolase